jgi:hypothetical protein
VFSASEKKSGKFSLIKKGKFPFSIAQTQREKVESDELFFCDITQLHVTRTHKHKRERERNSTCQSEENKSFTFCHFAGIYLSF